MQVRPLQCIVATLGAVVISLSPVAVAAHPAVPTCFGERATIVDRSEDSTVRGTPGRDVIVVVGRTTARAGGGDDLVCGAGSIWGGAGDDRIAMRGHPNGELSFTVAFGGPGNDEIHRDEPRTFDPHFFLESYGGPGDDRLSGGLNPDLLAGGPGADRVRGGALRDILFGGYGADHLLGGFRSDRLHGGPGADVIFGQYQNDMLTGDDGNDLILGGDGEDFARGRRGNDRILGQAGVDRVDGGPGADVCWAEEVSRCRS